MLNIHQTKFVKSRQVPMHLSIVEALSRYCWMRNLAGESAQDDAPFFVGTLAQKKVSPHILRHTTAMHLLQSGVPFNIIALWLGHESTNTTHRYVEADLAMKERRSPDWKHPTPSCDDIARQTRS